MKIDLYVVDMKKTVKMKEKIAPIHFESSLLLKGTLRVSLLFPIKEEHDIIVPNHSLKNLVSINFKLNKRALN